MQCVFLFRDAAGRLPTAEDLLRCGFRVSAAARPEGREEAQAARHASLALAAEAAAAYPSRDPHGAWQHETVPGKPQPDGQQSKAPEGGGPSAEVPAPGA